MRIKNLIPVSWTSVFINGTAQTMTPYWTTIKISASIILRVCWDGIRKNIIINIRKPSARNSLIMNWRIWMPVMLLPKAMKGIQLNWQWFHGLPVLTMILQVNISWKPTFVRTPLPVLRKVTVGDIFLLSRVHGASARKHLWKVQKTAGCPDWKFELLGGSWVIRMHWVAVTMTIILPWTRIISIPNMHLEALWILVIINGNIVWKPFHGKKPLLGESALTLLYSINWMVLWIIIIGRLLV